MARDAARGAFLKVPICVVAKPSWKGGLESPRLLGFCGWALAGGTAFFAIWELGNFSVLIGNSPLLPAAVREAPPAGAFRPAGGPQETDSGCTQAPIDRSSGQTTPADCHTSVPGHETMTALLTGRRFAR